MRIRSPSLTPQMKIEQGQTPLLNTKIRKKALKIHHKKTAQEGPYSGNSLTLLVESMWATHLTCVITPSPVWWKRSSPELKQGQRRSGPSYADFWGYHSWGATLRAGRIARTAEHKSPPSDPRRTWGAFPSDGS